MKKRILSLLLACFMVVSTFIISKPLVRVHAEDEQGTSVYGEWVFSGDATDYTKDNNFDIKMYPNYTGSSSGSYIATALFPSTTAKDLVKLDGWKYAIGETAGDAYISYKGTNDLGGISVNLGPANYNISIEFTAPSDGIYSFEEVVKQLEATTAQGSNRGYENIFAFFVAKDNTIYASYTTKPGSSADNPSIGTLSGYVTMKQGEVLRFVVSEGFSNLDLWDARSKTEWYLSMESLVVKKVADLSPKTDITEAVYAPAFDGTSYESNNFLLQAIMRRPAQNDYWHYFMNTTPSTEPVDSFSANWWGQSKFDIAGGVITANSGATQNSNGNIYGNGIQFTAPEDGTYMMSAFVVQTHQTSANNSVNYAIVKNYVYNTPVSVINYSGATTKNTLNGVKVPMSGTVELKKGDTLVLIIDPDTAVAAGADTCKIYDLQVVKVTVPGHPGEAHTDAGAWSSDADSHFFNRECCDHTDMDIPHVWNGDNVCDDCNYVCENHKWAEGVCEYCGTACVHDTPETWGTSQTEHYKYCNNSCGTELVREAHNWANGACTVCEYECVHTWNAVTGTCTNCGLGCTHTVTENDANCQADAVCETCGYTYKNPTNHVSNEFTYTEIDGVTHKVAHKCCGTEAPDEDCVYGNDNICDNCGYDKTVEVETEDVENAINNILNGGTADVTVVGPTTGMDANFDIEKPATTPADYEFKYLNIYFDENDNVVLRMTFIVTGEVTVTLNNNEATLKQDDGYNTYYLDVTPVAGEYDVANVVTVNGDTYNVSLYSYIKLALEGEVDLTDAEETLLRALYDLNEAMR